MTAGEDAELRQLTWFAKAGHLSEKSQTRLSELKQRDRRDAVRDPRPDPTSRGTRPTETKLHLEPVGSSTCPNCGFALLQRGPYSSHCSNCGFAVRNTAARPHETVPPATSPTLNVPAGPLGGSTYLALLTRAAFGGVDPVMQEIPSSTEDSQSDR